MIIKLPRDRVLVNTKNQIDIKLKMMTKGKGVDIIFNFLSGEAFEAAFNTVADHGKFFNFSKSDMKTHRNLGNINSIMGTCLNFNMHQLQMQNIRILKKLLLFVKELDNFCETRRLPPSDQTRY